MPGRLLVNEIQAPANFKTKIFEVVTKDRTGLLGQIKWYSQWRKYVFYPTSTTLFDSECLTELAEVCHTKTEEHKNG